MKVSIGPYKTWWGVYQTCDLLQKVGVSADTCEDIGDWICENTPAEDFFNWIDKLKGDRKVKIRIDKYDTWNMDRTLAHIIIPMLKQLKETKHGSAVVDDEDLPTHMRHGIEDDNWVHYRWEWVLKEMIWAFENLIDDSWEDQFIHGEPKYEDTEEENENYDMCFSYKQVNPDYWVDRDAIKEYNDRINNGFRLFGKYYRSLWD